MEQTDLWDDTIWDALGSAVKAAGGVKKVAGRLWPAMDEAAATTRLRACLNRDHAQKFDEDERLMVMKLASEAGDNSVMEFLGRQLRCEVKVLAPQEAKKRVKKARIAALLAEAARLSNEE
jgi:hypothetical protein